MANDISHTLAIWHPMRDQHQWVLATIYQTDGSSYRKIGAHMMINDLGQYYGMLSGGCLESDIMQQARRCWESQCNRLIEYDMREEEDLAWQLGIGCGGMVRIILQPVNKENDYLLLDKVHQCLLARKSCQYQQAIHENTPQNALSHSDHLSKEPPKLVHSGASVELIQTLCPPYHLTVVGGGVDARPVIRIATELGWSITLVDPRASYARKEHFPESVDIVKQSPLDIINQLQGQFLQTTDAVVIMSHNLELDAKGLTMAAYSHAKFVGILGPEHRTKRVLERTQYTLTDYPKVLSNPVGLRLGGELPESIALSIVAEVHAYLEHADGQSISHVLEQSC
ncbi:XdhC family protein [Aliiglaciecola litoralis]|uniref:XdhC/CoxI family protein n=1 Tax=Aliiglaciecola litoralis TaxID=582857 RepID=A0ABN1LCR0_9ALTE